MKAMLAVIVAAGLAGCANRTIAEGEFVPHGRFAAAERGRALAECRAQATMQQQTVQAAMRARNDVLGGALEGSQARMLVIRDCMDAKGYTWTNPRWGD